MEDLVLQQPDLVGRDEELSKLKKSLDSASEGKGSTIFIAGEAGIGKTRLTDAFKNTLVARDITVLSGTADAHSTHPFLVLSKALGTVVSRPLFEERELKSFIKIFAVNRAGLLVAQASSEEEELDADIFAGMLSAVQDFVRDSFDQEGKKNAHLGRLEYGDMKILMEHGEHLFLTTVFKGSEHADMKGTMMGTLREIEEKNKATLENWTGNMAELEPVQEEISKLADARFLVRRDLEGVKLENERIRKADEILEALKRLSSERPMVIFLEDLHWADKSSLFVINYLARNIRKHPILLLGTLRPRESDTLQRVIENMKNEEIVDVMALEKLDIENTISLINRTFSPNDFPGTLAEGLYEQSKGNPLFVIEMLRGMHDDGSIAELDGKYSLVSESYQIPTTVEEAVNRRLDVLDPDSMAMVEYVSCIGQRFDPSLAASNQMMKDPDASLEKLLASGILLKKNGTMEFSHAVFQSVIYNSIGERWKTGHHKNLGEYLEITYADRLDEVIYELARHFSRTKEYKKVSDYCTRAGEKTESSFALEQALSFYKEALAALSKLDVTHAHDSILDILERTGDIQALIGNYDGAIENFLKAKETSNDKKIKARMLMKVGDAHEKKGEYDKSLEVLAEARAVAEEGTAEYGRILFAEGYPYLRKGDYDKAMPLFLQAIETAEEAGGDRNDIGNALRAVGIIYHRKGEYDEAMQYYEKSLAVMEEIGEEYGISAVLNNIGILYKNKGMLDRALEYQGRSLEIQEKIGDKQGVAMSLMNTGSAHNTMGEPERALEFYARSLEIQEKIGDKGGAATSLNNIGNVYHNIGELDKAQEFDERSLEIREKIGEKQGVAMSLNNIGERYLENGEFDRAQEHYEKSLAIFIEIGEKRASIHVLCSLAEAKLGKSDARAALEHIEKAISVSIEIGTKPGEGISRRVLGMIYREMKDFGKADEEFNKAAIILQEVGEKRELAQLSYEHALLYKAMGETDKACEHLEQTIAMFEDMGMILCIDKCRKALDELG